MKEKIIDKNYDSIPHLSTSKMFQQADKKISEGQELILTKKIRDWKDLVIVTEKIDGSNVGIIKKNGDLIPITRAGYHALSSPYTQHRLFAKWVELNKNKFEWIPEGLRICGEWCIMAHGTIYDITGESPFVAFDIIDEQNKRFNYIDFMNTCSKFNIQTVPVLHIGAPISIKNAVKLLGAGHYGDVSFDKPEGVVYRVEKNNKFDFAAKWVRHDKEDGVYMRDAIYNHGSEYILHLFNT